MTKTFLSAALVTLLLAAVGCGGSDSKSGCEKLADAAFSCSGGEAGTVAELKAACDATVCDGPKKEAVNCVLDYGTCGDFVGNMCNCLDYYGCDMPSECLAAPPPQ